MSFAHFTALTAAILASTLIAKPIAETKVRDITALWEANEISAIRQIEISLPAEVRQDIAVRRSDGLLALNKPTIEFPKDKKPKAELILHPGVVRGLAA